MAPSSKLYWLWTWRCVNSDVDIKLGGSTPLRRSQRKPLELDGEAGPAVQRKVVDGEHPVVPVLVGLPLRLERRALDQHPQIGAVADRHLDHRLQEEPHPEEAIQQEGAGTLVV